MRSARKGRDGNIAAQAERTANWLRLGSYCAPVGVITGIWLLNIVFPEFYGDYVLSYLEREHQAVELATFAFALASAIVLFRCAVRLRTCLKRSALPHRFPLGAALILFWAVVSFVVAGEEINWGQTFFRWEMNVEELKAAGQTSIHNSLYSNSEMMANLALITFFGLFPIFWKSRFQEVFSADTMAAVPEGPSIFAVAVAMLCEGDSLFLSPVQRWLFETVPHLTMSELSFVRFQMGEQKELLASIALLIYSAYRVGVVRTFCRSEHEPTGIRE
jgi:hypothetical protein